MPTDPIRQAVVLVGGRGSRLADLTLQIPKPLLPIDGDRVFLDYIMELIARHGYTDIVLLAGYLGEQVERRYTARTIGEATIRVLREPAPLGTGGALTVAREILDDAFVLMNGDALFDINLRALEVEARTGGALATLALKAVDDASRYGRVIMEDGRIVAFLEKDVRVRGPGTINGGVYVLQRGLLDLIGRTPCSIERDVFPRLAERDDLRGRAFEGYFIDIGTPESLARGRRELPENRVRPAAFLDRDGVLNIDRGYTHRPEDLHLVPGAAEAVRRLNDLGYLVLVVSNQAGIARGYYSISDAVLFNQALQARLACEGAHIDRFYISPYHPDGTVPAFATDHEDRKPNPGMLRRAFAEWPIAKAGSFLIGDKATDIEAAERAGLRGFLLAGGRLDDMVETTLISLGTPRRRDSDCGVSES